VHRLAHALWRMKLRWLGRFASHCSRFLTGIEIHPGAKIGRRVFIDHGMGWSSARRRASATTARLYHGVTLGAPPGTRASGIRRWQSVVIGAGAKCSADRDRRRGHGSARTR